MTLSHTLQNTFISAMQRLSISRQQRHAERLLLDPLRLSLNSFLSECGQNFTILLLRSSDGLMKDWMNCRDLL